MDERWRLENSDNELKFFFDDKLVIHLFQHNSIWSVNVLGYQKIHKCHNLSDAIQTAENVASQCGWL